MAVAIKCEKCGNAFDHGVGCQVCLLQLGLSRSGSAGADLPSLVELNSRFPQLEITRLIGRGGMGAIYQARQTSLDRDVALKLIAKEVSQDPLFVERFEREAKTLAKLSHPNIVTIYDFGYTADGVAYLIMEFVDGINLREAMKSRSIGPEDALDVVATICRALEFAHSRGVIHRDIKPENILLSEDGCLKVVDFGIAKIVDDSVRTPTLTATRQVLGSLHYLAPEQLESPELVDHRVDLYALGVVFYELLTGELPLGRYEAPSTLYNRADKRVDQVVLKSLSRKPGSRFQTAKEFGAEIQRLQAEQSVLGSKGDATSAHTPPPIPQASELNQPISVPFNCDLPFTCDTFGGFAEVLGLIYASQKALCFEFRTRDKIMGVIKSKATLVEIPFERLTRCELVTGVFSSQMVISANSLAVMSELPNSESGTVKFQIKRSDVASAKRLLNAIGFGQRTSSLAHSTPEFGSPEYNQQAIFGGLMVLCGVLNLGCLAIGQIVNAHADHSSTATLAIAAIAIAVLYGSIALLQLVGGVLNFVMNMQPLNGVLSIVSLIPISPAWLISFPAAMWASPWMRSQDASQVSKPGWGATTLMFMRESRWSKVVAMANAIGLGAVAIAAVLYVGGFYTSTGSYRISGPQIPSESELLDSLQKRLTDVAPTAELRFDDSVARLTITDWRYNSQRIQDALQIESNVQLAWLEPDVTKLDETKRDETKGTAVSWLPLAGRLDVAGLATGSEGLSTTLATNQPLFELRADMIASVKTNSDGLSIELSKVGRDSLAELRPASERIALGIVIGGMVEGVASGQAITNKRIAFRLCKQSELNASAIESAVRGPSLPFELELISD